MTTIAYRFGILAADSRATCEAEGMGTHTTHSQKLFSKEIGRLGSRRRVWIALAGDNGPGLLLLDWYSGPNSGKLPVPAQWRMDVDLAALVLDDGELYYVDEYLRPERLDVEHMAIGTGAQAALAVMRYDPDCSAADAVAAASQVDPYTGGPIVTSEEA